MEEISKEGKSEKGKKLIIIENLLEFLYGWSEVEQEGVR